MININLERSKKKNLYEKIYEELKNLIIDKEIKEGEKLPSKRVFKENYDVSVTTVERAYAQLIDEGYIRSEERRGYFVNRIDDFILNKDKSEIEDSVQNNERKDAKLQIFKYRGCDMEYFPYRIFQKVYDRAINDSSSYTQCDFRGSEKLRDAIRSYLYRNRGFKTSIENIAVSSSSEYLFHNIYRLLRKKTFALEEGSCGIWRDIFKIERIDYCEIKLDDEGADIEDIREKNMDIMILTPSHQFPSGIIMPINRRVEILNYVNEREGAYVIEDDYDSEFKFEGRPLPAMKSIDRGDKVIYFGSFSKSISPSFRLSFMVLPDNFMKEYSELYGNLSCGVSGVTQKALELFIKEGHFERHLNRMRMVYKKKRRILKEKLFKAYESIRFHGGSIGLYYIISFSDKKDEEDFLSFIRYNDYDLDIIENYRRSDEKAFIVSYASIEEKDLYNLNFK